MVEQTAQLDATMLLRSRCTGNWLANRGRCTNRGWCASLLMEQVALLARCTFLNNNNLLNARGRCGTGLLSMTTGHCGHYSNYSKANHGEYSQCCRLRFI